MRFFSLFCILLFLFNNKAQAVSLDSTINKISDFYFNTFDNTEQKASITAEAYFQEGMEFFDDGNYKSSFNSFENLQKYYPFSLFNKEAMLMEALLGFLTDDYLKVVSIVDLYFIIYPNDIESPYMLYIKGRSIIKNIKSETRSANLTKEGIETFQTLINQYPNSKYTPDAKKKLQELMYILYINDFKIAQFHEARDELIPAMIGYGRLLSTIKDKNIPKLYNMTEEKLKNLYKIFGI